MPKEVETLRIIAGLYRHRRILFPHNGTRPTKDKVREAIFSSLGEISGFDFLDLYAGSGSMGLEALSRGADSATFIDNSVECIRVIRENITSLEVNDKARAILSSVESGLTTLSNEGKSFDLIYIDPPYDEEKYQENLETISHLSLLKKNGIIIIESNHPLNDDDYPDYIITKQKNFGFINLTYLKEKE